MITYVNTVLVSNEDTIAVVDASALAAQDTKEAALANKGKFVVDEIDNDKFRIGLIQNATNVVRKKNANAQYVPVVKWTNDIQKDAVKSFTKLDAPTKNADGEDKVTIDFSKLDNEVAANFAKGGKRVILRLTFKDLPTRYRKWTESYEFVTEAMDIDGETTTAATVGQKVAEGLRNLVNNEWKRARVEATVENNTKLVLTAMPYDDDNDPDTINWANKVRFNANIYYTDPAAEGWESLNKHFPAGVTIEKEPGKQYPAIGKLVRDRESQALGYQGILNRGMCTWPIIKPALVADNDTVYNALTLEFENIYHTADDLHRKTKQTVEIYTKGAATDLISKLTALVGEPKQQNVTTYAA